VWPGRVTGAGERLATQHRSPRPKASTPSGEGSQRMGPSPRAGSARRSRSAARYSSSIESGSPACSSTVSSRHSLGWGSQGEAEASGGEKPNGGSRPARLLRHGVTGIICASDVLALGAIRAVRRAGLSVPGDVSVVGYDDSAFMNCTDPPLTTVRQPIESMGKAAVALLVNQMENASVYPEELLFEPELVVRGSTGPVPAAPAGPAP